MREILFRGKCENEWFYGYALKDAEDNMYILWYDDYYDEWMSSLVDYESVGQYSELEDKNGVKIFEGDVVLCDRHVNDEFDKKTFFVREIYPISGLIGESLSGNEICGDDWEFAEVIGNIHDNPELLKEGGEE